MPFRTCFEAVIPEARQGKQEAIFPIRGHDAQDLTRFQIDQAHLGHEGFSTF